MEGHQGNGSLVKSPVNGIDDPALIVVAQVGVYRESQKGVPDTFGDGKISLWGKMVLGIARRVKRCEMEGGWNPLVGQVLPQGVAALLVRCANDEEVSVGSAFGRDGLGDQEALLEEIGKLLLQDREI